MKKQPGSVLEFTYSYRFYLGPDPILILCGKASRKEKRSSTNNTTRILANKKGHPGYPKKLKQLTQLYPGPLLSPGFHREKNTIYEKAIRVPHTHYSTTKFPQVRKQSSPKPLPGPKIYTRANTFTAYEHLKQPCPKST